MDPNQQQPQDDAGKRWAPGQNPFLTQPLSGEGSSQLPQPQMQAPQNPNLNIQQSAQPQPVNGGGTNSPNKNNQGGFNKILIIVVGVIALLVIAGGLIVVAMSGDSSKQENQETTSQDSGQPPSLQPATALDIQQVNNAITNDMSTVDDESDYPNDSLTDKSLGL